MDEHEFTHVLSLIHAESKRCLRLLPFSKEKERIFMQNLKRSIEDFEVSPESILIKTEE